MEASDYNALEDVLLNAAIGGEFRVDSETQTEDYVDDKGRRRHNTRTKKADAPNVALAAKLLGERIGGPQDFC